MDDDAASGERAAQTLQLASELHRPLARAARLAHGNGSVMLVIGTLSALFGLIGPDGLTFAMGGIAAATGWFERRDGERLRRGEEGAPAALARNELLLLGAVAIYCVLNMTLLKTSSQELEQAMGGGLPGLDIQQLTDRLTNLVYPTLLVVSLLVQGGLARHYARQRTALERYRREVPDWARTAVESISA
jgi:hypothetical protein